MKANISAPRIEQCDLEGSIADRLWLPDQLVQPLFDNRTVAALVHVEAVGSAWRLAVDRHANACAQRRAADEVTVVSIEVVAMTDVTPTVFVVDDDVSVRESLELLLRTAGWRPEAFESAREFLSRPRATTPCCLVLDVTLPGLNGLELQHQLAGRTDMPIIFITGYGDVPTTVQAMKAGAVEFLTKPFKDEVLALVEDRRARGAMPSRTPGYPD